MERGDRPSWSRQCKQEFFRLYLNLLRDLGDAFDGGMGANSMPPNLQVAKQRSADYMRGKKEFEERLQTLGYGNWFRRPPEEKRVVCKRLE